MRNEDIVPLFQKGTGMRIPYRDSNWHRRHWLMETALFPCHRSTAAFRVEMGLPKTAEGRPHETPSCIQ
ncbi:hypothetical protein TNIN_250111 [Trichonephila inaurata madagascariensis]|uniref:Uncharacterized protein n=1 Tax=Trichonephila inaurata madagascariensis TaxID=2747483 RepID=A0A8X7C590_9ARAC|nr:hypothetical protein TNIN_250111 [Trichonephila inaurata madagascariensis]